MSKILQISKCGDGSGFALDFKRWGNEVKIWIKEPQVRKENFGGFVEKLDDWKSALKWCDFVFFDSNGMSDVWKEAVKSKPCFGGSEEGEKMEKDRAFAHSLMKKAGMLSFESEIFKTAEEAIGHLKSHKVKHAVKPIGKDAGSDDICLSEWDDGKDAISLLELFKEKKKKCDYIEIEERIFGVEAGVAGYFNGKEWIGPIEINFQTKHIACGWPGESGGMGPLCGESGTTIKYVSQESAFFKKTLFLFTDHLKKINYRGEIDIGCIVNESGIYPIEFTPRKGYPDGFIRRELTVTPEPDLYFALAKGEKIDYKTKPGWAVGLLYMVPGFPWSDALEDHAEGYPVFGYDPKNVSMHLQQVNGTPEKLTVNKWEGYAAVLTGCGDTIESARRKAYWQIRAANEKRLSIPSAWIRTDIGMRVIESKDEIIEYGILTEGEWKNS